MKTKKCFGCKISFTEDQLTFYTTATAQTGHWYCKNCLHDKLEREKFSTTVCTIFGLRTPGPRIWTERKRLIDKYGYTDNTIIKCLNYLYNVEKKKKLADSLCLVNPTNVDKSIRWEKEQQYNANKLLSAVEKMGNANEQAVQIKEHLNEKKELNPDEWLDFD